jgi:hypothetical protein
MNEKMEKFNDFPESKSDYINELTTIVYHLAKGRPYSPKKYEERSQGGRVGTKIDAGQVETINNLAGELEDLGRKILIAEEETPEKELAEKYFFEKANELVEFLYDGPNEERDRDIRKNNLKDFYDSVKNNFSQTV